MSNITTERLEQFVGSSNPTSAEIHDMAVELILSRRHPKPVEVGVRKLEWWTPDASNNHTHGAHSILGTYYVNIDGGRHNGWNESYNLKDKIEQWEGPTCGMLYEAQRHCQDHFDARIRSALTLTAAKGVEVTEAMRDVLAERQRQREVEGWTVEHDDQHSEGELAKAAGVYALAAASHDYRYALKGLPVNDYLAATFKMWPWDWGWFKPKNRRRDMVKAAALLLAEIERHDRAALSEAKHGTGAQPPLKDTSND